MASFQAFTSIDPLLCFLSRGEEDSLVIVVIYLRLLPMGIFFFLTHKPTNEPPRSGGDCGVG